MAEVVEGEFREARVEGPEGEKWASWLVHNRQEVESIQSPELKTAVRLLARRPDSMVNPEALEKTYDRIDQLLSQGTIKGEDAALWQGRISSMHEQLAGRARITEFTPEAFARALGVAGPDEQLRLYRDAERAILPIKIEVGAEPKFWPSITPEKQEEWKARGSLATAAATKKAAAGYEKLFPNDEAVGLAKADIEALMGRKLIKDEEGKEHEENRKGAIEALSVYVALIADRKTEESVLLNQWSNNEALSDIKANLPKSFFETKDMKQLLGFRDAMENWLQKNFNLSKDEAADAEHIAWNFVYLSNIVEYMDSKLNGRPSKKDEKNEETIRRLPPIPGLKSLPVWMMMHPEERLEGKLGTEESWSQLGEWALDNMRRFKNEGWTPAKADILPDNMFQTAFHEIKISKKIVVDEDTGKERKEALYDFLLKQGKILIENPASDLDTIDWAQIRENPFSSYYFDKINPAILIFSVIDTGSLEKRLSDLGTACRKLDMERKFRETVLLAHFGVDTKAKSLKFVGGAVEWMGILQGIHKYAPNFFD